MKKIISMLLILLVAGVLFADPTPATAPSSATFTVKTDVNGVAFMGVTKETFAETGVDPEDYNAYENLDVSESGEQDFTAYITSFSNTPGGYKITMSASAMTNATNAAEIHYIVGADNGSNVVTFDTKNTQTAVEVYNSGSLTAMTGHSYPLTLSVDSESFAAATTGAYSGTVTFAYTAL